MSFSSDYTGVVTASFTISNGVGLNYGLGSKLQTTSNTYTFTPLAPLVGLYGYESVGI